MGSEVGRPETEGKKSENPKAGLRNIGNDFVESYFFQLLTSVFSPLQQEFH